MRIFLGILLLFSAISYGSHVYAEREVHVVAVGKGQPSDDAYASPEAHVLVDRPGREVGLVLLDGGELNWHVEATDGTIITEIVRSGKSSQDSAVILSGIPMTGVHVPGLPLVFSPWGRDFRVLIDILADLMGTGRIQSFQGAHQSRGQPLRVDRVDLATAGLAKDYLNGLIASSSDLPTELANWLATGESESIYSIDFGTSGISLSGPSGTQRFPVPDDVPEILLPVTAVYAHDTQTIYGVSYGAEGYLYSVDVTTGQWKLITSLNGYDAASLLYDPDTGALVMTGAFSRPGDIRVFGFDGSRFSTFIPATTFPGLTDLFDFGNEYGPPLTPRVYTDGWLLLEALGQDTETYPNAGQYRIYAVQIETGEIRLLRYRND